jgi:hypothetical protein
MDIKKLTSKQINGAQLSRKQHSVSGITSAGSSQGKEEDKLSLSSYTFRQNELLFAKTEYQKQSQTSFEKLREMKAQLDEYQAASRVSREDAAETAIGRKLSDPSVWEKIARKVSDT